MPKLAGINHLRAIRAFERAGFRITRQGKHVSMKRGAVNIVVPRNNPINAFLMAQIVKGAGMTIEEFKDLL